MDDNLNGQDLPIVLPTSDQHISGRADDSRRIMTYLIAPESEDYIAIMDALEGSVTDMSPTDVANALVNTHPLEVEAVEVRLEQLRSWAAVSARADSTKILRYADLLARNWRYTASSTGRQVQRFYRTVLAGILTLREIPLTSLNRVVTILETLARSVPDSAIDGDVVEQISILFTSHDDLDGALVGAEDSLASLADRFDLTDERTAELKGLLVDYATRVAAELDTGSARATRALVRLRPHFLELSGAAIEGSQARVLIERGALTASRGGRGSDWEGLSAWFDPDTGRANRFSLRLVRSLPGMHVNLRRLHTSAGTGSSRIRALALARAAADPMLGTQVWQAALGDHSWRKLSGEADEDESLRNPSWRGGPSVGVPELLRSIGRAGPRGKGGASRDDTRARAEIAAARSERQERHDAALREVLAARVGAVLSETAARVALSALMLAARTHPSGSQRTGARDGLACTLVHTGFGVGSLVAPTWSVLLPGRVPVFHLPYERPPDATMLLAATVADPDLTVDLNVHPSVPSKDMSVSDEL